MPPQVTFGRVCFTLNALLTSFGAYIADWNTTHIYNPRWPPHAKFHNGQTMSMGLLLGFGTLYYAWIRPRKTIEGEQMRLGIITLLGSLYWVTQVSGLLYPGSLAVDPEFGDEVLPQIVPVGICLGSLAMGIWAETRTLKVNTQKHD